MTDTLDPPVPPVPGRPRAAATAIEPVDIQQEMQRSYIDYAMCVIVGRALPLVEDGLKPVHRRVLYSMGENGFRPDRSYVKCARVVGEVMGNYHPHGDTSIYDALVRLAQPWSMRYPLIDGQGNFGSPGNDPAAAMRYTECRLSPLAMAMLQDIDEDTVDFADELRRQDPGARRPAGAGAEPADQRQRRDRRRHGHQHPAAQPARGRRGRRLGARATRRPPRRSCSPRSWSASRAPTSRPPA